jgi:hypothetical protein
LLNRYSAVVKDTYLGVFNTALEAAVARDTYIVGNKLDLQLKGVLHD